MITSAVAFGFSFPAAKVALGFLGPLQVLFWTRLVAGITLLPGSAPSSSPEKRWRQAAGPGLLLGVLLMATFGAQLIGLSRTTASHAGLIGSVHLVATPLIAAPLIGERPAPATAVGAGLCLLGAVVVSGGVGPINVGDLLVFAGALLLSLHTIVIARWTRTVGARDLIRGQTLVAGLLALIGSMGRVDPAGALKAAPALIVGGVLGGSLAITAQMIAQRSLPAGQTALIMALEPVVAILVAIVWLGERPLINTWLGAVIIVSGILVGIRAPTQRIAAPARLG
jgi:drug/metabolite transporter (DMT)-like permease